MNLKKIKIILFLPLALFFIANLFYFSLPAEAAQTCSWWYTNPGPFPKNDCSYLQGTTLTPGGCDSITKPTGGTASDYICCCKQAAAPSAPVYDMPKLKIPELQISIPGLTFTKAEAIKCTEANGKKSCNIPWIGEYIAAIYKYAIGIVGILAAVILMIGGVIWIVAGGSATAIGEAKSWIGASLTGLVIALCSYLILFQINPALTIFGPLGITQVKKTDTPIVGTRSCKRDISCSGNYEQADEKFCTKALTDDGTICCCAKPIAACQPVTTGNCSVANLMAVFGEQAGHASTICQGESNGTPGIGSSVDICADGKVASWGLFQINITAHKINGLNCPSAFSNGPYTASNHNCRVTDQALYDQCVNAAKDPNSNIQKAYELSSMGYNWNPWGFYTKTCKSYF